MNNRINALKKRADTLAEYVVERCARLEKENACMKHEAEIVRRELSGYEEAFFDVFNKMERIEKFKDGSIDLGFKDINGKDVGVLISIGNPLHPLANILFEKVKVWRMKR